MEEISKFKKEIKFIYEEMNRPYYKSNAKNDPLGPKLEQFYHTAFNDMEVLEQASALPVLPGPEWRSRQQYS